ncbi:hypothetical protein ACFQL4_16445 [Halosimplex aquaticum]
MSDPVELDSPALSTYVVLAGVVELSVRERRPRTPSRSAGPVTGRWRPSTSTCSAR